MNSKIEMWNAVIDSREQENKCAQKLEKSFGDFRNKFCQVTIYVRRCEMINQVFFEPVCDRKAKDYEEAYLVLESNYNFAQIKLNPIAKEHMNFFENEQIPTVEHNGKTYLKIEFGE